MRKVFLPMLVAGLAMMMAACETQQDLVTTVESQQFSEARVLQVETYAKIDSVRAKLNVYMRVEWSKDYSPEQVKSMDYDVQTLHSRAAFDLLKEHRHEQADELVAPTWNVYNIVDRNDPHHGWYRVEVIGFLARFEEWNGQKSVLENKVEHSPSTH